MNRRQFLQTFGVSVVAVGSLQRALAALPAGALAPLPAARSPAHHVVERLTYGITPSLYRRVRQGDPATLIAEQLAPEQLDDGGIEQRLGDYADVLATNGGVLAQQDAAMRQTVGGALLASVLTHALYSERQLYERMVYFFWQSLLRLQRQGSRPVSQGRRRPRRDPPLRPDDFPPTARRVGAQPGDAGLPRQRPEREGRAQRELQPRGHGTANARRRRRLHRKRRQRSRALLHRLVDRRAARERRRQHQLSVSAAVPR